VNLEPERLAQALGKTLPSLFLVYGDEPLQRLEAVDAIRRAARTAGAEERLSFDAATGIDWDFLRAETMSLSLFAGRRIFELDLGKKKPDADAQAFISTWAARQDQQDFCILCAEQVKQDEQQAGWFRAVSSSGIVVACRLPEGEAFRHWLQARAGARGKTLSPEAVDFLCARTEGNLLAAAQEIDLLQLLVDEPVISLEHALAAVSDSARYDVYKVVDSALTGDVARAVRMLRGVRDEGTDPVVLAWSAGRELRVLARVAAARSVDAGFAAERVWASRQNLLRRVLRRLAAPDIEALLRESVRIDQMAKGMREGDPWEALESLLMALAGGPRLGELA